MGGVTPRGARRAVVKAVAKAAEWRHEAVGEAWERRGGGVRRGQLGGGVEHASDGAC
jgi:hypothetical protein